MKTDKKWAGHWEWHEGHPYMSKDASGKEYVKNEGWMRVQIVKLDGSGEMRGYDVYPTDWRDSGRFRIGHTGEKLPKVNGVTPEDMVTYSGRVKYQEMVLKELLGVTWDEVEWIE